MSQSEEDIHKEEEETGDVFPEQRASPAHEAIFLVLTYLPLFELLAMTRVCKSLRDAVNHDILPWLQIIVKPPLSSRVSDDILLKIVSRADGRLKFLSLINCPRITDDGLLRIAAQNPLITKLHVPYCLGISPLGVLNAVKLLTQRNNNLSSLRIDGVHGITRADLESLQDLIDPDHKLREKDVHIYYHKYKMSSPSTLLNSEIHRPVDVDICPICHQVGMIFSCPLLHCEKVRRGIPVCIGCETCIPRCKECGECLSDVEGPEEAACADALCLECWLRLPKCSFCNRPYCNEHAGSQLSIPGSVGFLCQSCYSKFYLEDSETF